MQRQNPSRFDIFIAINKISHPHFSFVGWIGFANRMKKLFAFVYLVDEADPAYPVKFILYFKLLQNTDNFDF